ncbi:hypothetical protein [Pseudidiomarina sp.]|uniref:hypothetical protein n=1 Tax=Pseudidiomarina sp. TaxID=2081707 RepID=UPI003A97C583
MGSFRGAKLALVPSTVWWSGAVNSADWIEQSTLSYLVTNAYMDFGYSMLWNVINPNEERETQSSYHTGVGIHILAVYPVAQKIKSDII